MAKKLYNARVAWQEAMPPLAEAFGGFQGFAPGELRVNQIYDLFALFIQRHRRAVARRFYPTRDLAKFFSVSASTIAIVFRRLHREGLLTLVRSSQTMIPPRTLRPRFALRGVVCMPIWMPGFLHFLDWRRRFSELEEELSRHRFVLEPIFFGQGEEVDSAFVDRVLKFNPDYVLWDGPVEPDRMTMESITDAGVPILTILDPKAKPLPGRIYRRSYGRALQRGLEEWKASGEIDRIVVSQFSKEDRQHELFLSILRSCSLPHEFKVYDPIVPLPRYFKHLMAARRAGIIFSDDVVLARLCILAPEEMFNLFRRHRVIVMRQVTIPSLVMPSGVTVDSLIFPNKLLVRRIAEDLSQAKGALPSMEEVFEAEWRPRTPIEEIAQIDFDA